MSDSREYATWQQMIQRCTNPKSIGWLHYGGRGISVCERWKDSFAAFYADMGDRPAGMSLDRIDNDGDYAPDNCRWTTRSAQRRNTTSNRMVTYNGLTLPLIEWCERLHLKYTTVHHRLSLGWTDDRALSTTMPVSHSPDVETPKISVR